MRALRAWLVGYRDAFRYAGRAARRDFLAFIVLHGLVAGMLPPGGLVRYALAALTLVTTLSYNVRRPHDSNRSGLLCVGYFLFAAPIVIIVSMLLAPVDAGNRYSPRPRGLL